MRTIKLTQNKQTTVDDNDYESLAVHRWCVYKASSGKYYAVRNSKRDNKGNHYPIKMHRVIMGLTKGDGNLTDHINGNTLDNRKANLRVVTIQQNNMNKTKQSNNKSGYKGVYKHSQYNKWVAQIKAGDKRIHIGVYNTAKEASKAYKEKALVYHGEYADQN